MVSSQSKGFSLNPNKKRLVSALTQFDPTSIDEVFGNEFANVTFSEKTKQASVQRIAIFSEAFFPKVDGVSKSAYMTLRYLQATGREVLVFAPDIAPPQVGETKIVPLPSISFPYAPETRMAFPTPMIRHELDEFQPDIIHLFSPAWMGSFGMREGRRRGLPIVANYQTDLPGYAKDHYGFTILAEPINSFLRNLHNRCHVNLVASQTIINQLQADGYRRLYGWKRGVDTVRFNPAHRSEEMRTRLLNGRDPASLLCIYVGRVAPEKDIDLLLDVAKTPGLALTIVGDGAARNDLEHQFAGTDTHFTGYVFGDDLAKIYASADVFMFTGPNETFGQVVQEAMASGIPSVIINQGGILDLVQDGINGFWCEPNRQAFVEAALKLKDATLRQTMGEKARVLAEQTPWSVIMEQLEAHYNQAVILNNRYRRAFPDLSLLELFEPLLPLDQLRG